MGVSLEPSREKEIKMQMKKLIPIIIVIFIFCFMSNNSKTEYYEKNKEFYQNSFSGEIEKIVEGRGTKIYYENDKYFYEDDFEGTKLKVGDVIRKNANEIILMRKNSNGEYVEIGKGKCKKPSTNYFNYFFGS
jgi:hypothetical protein